MNELERLAEKHFSIPIYGERKVYETFSPHQGLEFHQCLFEECDDLMLFILSSLRHVVCWDYESPAEFAEDLHRCLPYREIDLDEAKNYVDEFRGQFVAGVQQEESPSLPPSFLKLGVVEKAYLLAYDWNFRSIVLSSDTRFIHMLWFTSE